MTLKNDEISEEELTCFFKIDIRNLTNFVSRTWVSEIYTLMGCFWPKYIMFEWQKSRGFIFHETKEWFKIWRKTDLWFRKWRNLAKFHQSTQKSQNWHFYWVVLLKSENVCALNLQESYGYNNEEWCKIWKEIDQAVQNWHEESDKSWPEHSIIWKICTLVCCFLRKYIVSVLRKYSATKFDGAQDLYRGWRKKMTWGIRQFFTRVLSLKNRTLMTFLRVRLKIYRDDMCHENEKWFEIWWAFENFKNLHFNGLLLNKVYNF